MVEKPLTHSRRKANPNFEKMKPELRQLEEQYVTNHSFLTWAHSGCRFTIYNFTNMKRMSYYPHNQPVTVTAAESDDTERTCTQSVTGTSTIIPTATIVERSEAGTPVLESIDYRRLPPIPQPSKGSAVS
jgi:serine/threonine kinase 32